MVGTIIFDIGIIKFESGIKFNVRVIKFESGIIELNIIIIKQKLMLINIKLE